MSKTQWLWDWLTGSDRSAHIEAREAWIDHRDKMRAHWDHEATDDPRPGDKELAARGYASKFRKHDGGMDDEAWYAALRTSRYTPMTHEEMRSAIDP